ncbi:MAG: hypothetical protein ACM3H7_08065 [Acidobacteriaceae bacterium]
MLGSPLALTWILVALDYPPGWITPWLTHTTRKPELDISMLGGNNLLAIIVLTMVTLLGTGVYWRM